MKTIIRASDRRLFPDFKELWAYRQLLVSLAWRDIRVKYAQTYIGLIWAWINPIFNLLVLGFVFGEVAKVNTGDVPHLLYTATGLCAWTYFSTLLSAAGNSIVGAQAMIKKIYFPRMVIPLSKALSGLVDFVIVLVCLLVLMIYYKTLPGSNIIYLPVFFFFAIISGLTGGILVSGLTTRYRDFSFVIPMFIRLGMFITPIAYPASAVPEKWKLLYFMNPMAGVVEGFRWSILNSGSPEIYMFYSLGIIFILFFVSLWYFTKVERIMADIL